MFSQLYESTKGSDMQGRYDPAAEMCDMQVKPSPTADTRTCDVSKVDKSALLASSKEHIKDLAMAMHLFGELLEVSADMHDHDKLTGIEEFHSDFKTKFEEHGWWDNHRKVNRHHLDKDDGVPEDVNLIDVLEHIADCVTAGMARSGKITPLKLSDKVLQAAFQNTVELLKTHVEVDKRS